MAKKTKQVQFSHAAMVMDVQIWQRLLRIDPPLQ
jgi:hypothetical protein